MSDITDLEQDIAALKVELEGLRAKRDALKDPGKDIQKDTSIAETNADRQLQSLLDQFPQLHDILLSDNAIDKSSPVLHNNGEDDTSLLSRKRKSEHGSPNTKHKRLSLSANLPEHEWVLKMQPPIEHKMFDTSVADVLGTDILSSPSKRIIETKERQSDNLQRTLILLEDFYKKLGVNFLQLFDPNDLEMNEKMEALQMKGDMLGVRFELPSSEGAQKYYLLLKKETASDYWIPYKHSLPNIIDVNEYFVNVAAESHEDIYLIAKDIYLQLLTSAN
ncbi:Mcm21p NDAI_0I01550 [Naumovozyma dairenensis CBS 421]|uniref:Uncharacterized protein n=1 Tax=Naumovozyma dairenensis (strain ATCC 10597 / BCRC 20456 / CBS 421 / NBRC 0211 / NRRL Y-12639) TaxID=1071378 RepID=G0WG13_NAUDC|nr:hypothetical protein NDAI_0I01550 [Naumovozyma dairenensis CBS 421]CCD26724.1 hypothetical protein NDAI_0I01550 [Naumovozyma dairenensis CBS 421]